MSKETQTEQKPKLVSDIMSKKVVSMNADTSVLELAKEMSSRNISSIILIDNDGSDIGVVTERDLTREVCAKDLLASKKVGRSIMSSHLITINEAASVEKAAETMVKNGTRHLLISER